MLFRSSGALTTSTAQPITVTADSDGNLSGLLTVGGNITSNGGAVSLSGRGITQSGGTVNAGAGTILVDANDGAINMAGTLTTTNATTSAVRIIDSTTAALGNINAVNGTVVLGQTTADERGGTNNLSGAVTQNTGTVLNVSTLTGTAGSTVVLGNANTVARSEERRVGKECRL